LFSVQPDEESDLQLDSLDVLDLALQIKEQFDPEGRNLEPLLNGEVDPMALTTVARISEFIMSALPTSTQPPSSGGDQPSPTHLKGVTA
jgi:acyl carrier protein